MYGQAAPAGGGEQPTANLIDLETPSPQPQPAPAPLFAQQPLPPIGSGGTPASGGDISAQLAGMSMYPAPHYHSPHFYYNMQTSNSSHIDFPTFDDNAFVGQLYICVTHKR